MAKVNILKKEEARELVDSVGASLGYDHTYDPIFPAGRKDVAAVCRMVENGSTYGYNVVYLVWKKNGHLNHHKLIDSMDTKDYINIDKVKAVGNKITVSVSSGGSYSGSPWKKTLTKTI